MPHPADLVLWGATIVLVLFVVLVLLPDWWSRRTAQSRLQRTDRRL